jgi:hypothetical protein
MPSFKYYAISGVPISLRGKWEINFESGGPVLPSPVEVDTLSSWTTFGGIDCQAFSGTASYTMSFSKPELITPGWILDLGSVRESAEVFLNGKSLGTLLGPVFQLEIDDSLLKKNNILEVKVSNLMANRIADLDKRNIVWKKFYNVNFPARKRENRKNGLFDASQWQPRDSGLLGPVQITPADIESGNGL